MAKLIEEIIMVKISTIIKDGGTGIISNIDAELLETIETVTQELVGASAIVEATVLGAE